MSVILEASRVQNLFQSLFVFTFYFEKIIESQEVVPSSFLVSVSKTEIGGTMVSLWAI